MKFYIISRSSYTYKKRKVKENIWKFNFYFKKEKYNIHIYSVWNLEILSKKKKYTYLSIKKNIKWKQN